MKLNWLLKDKLNLEPPSLPSIVTFHTYEGCVNATRFHQPLLPVNQQVLKLPEFGR